MRIPNVVPIAAVSKSILNRILVLLMVVAFLLPGGQAQAAAPEQPAPPEEATPLDLSRYRLPIEDYTLRNGLRVVLAQDNSAPVVAVNVTYWVGAAHDPVGRSGFAHLFEHMMFYGSENVPYRQFGAYLAKIGADPTSFNAYTNFDRTAYYATVPANQLPLLLWLESDRMASLVVDQESFDTERNVVIEELNQRLYNSAYGVPYLRSYALPFLGYAPYNRFVIGSKEELEAATLDEVIAFHDRYYVPNNATLTIVGDIDLPVTKALVEAYFGDIPAGDPLTPILAQYPMPKEFPVLRTDEATGCNIGYEEVMIDALAEQPLAIGMVVGPKPADPDFPAAVLLATILGTGNSSRLQRNLVQTGLVPFAYAWIDPATLSAFTFQFEVYVEEPDDLDPALTLIREEMYKLVRDGVSEEELARAKNQMIINMVNSYYATVGNTAEQLQFYTFSYGDPDFLQNDIERLQAVTVDEVQAAAKKYLCERPLSVISVFKEGEAVPVTHPGVTVEQVVAADPLAGLPEGIVSRTQAPVALPAGAIEVPAFTTFTLENGLTVALVQQDKAPVVRFSLYTGGGSASVAEGKRGVAELLAAVITKGTETLSAEEIAAQVESIGGTLAATAAAEHIAILVSGPSFEHERLLEVLADVAMHPTFPEAEFSVAQQQLIADMAFNASDPLTLADRQFRRMILAGHPYSAYSTPEVMEELTPEDLAAFHADYFVPGNALLVITGDMTELGARRQVERLFSEWPAGDAPDYLNYPEVTTGAQDVIYLIDQPAAGQAIVRVGNRAIHGAAEDRFALLVANHALGGRSQTSRLYLNLRVDKGYTYGVRSNLDMLQDAGAFVIAGSVNIETAGAAIQEILFELDRLSREGLSDDELANAKGFLTGQYLMQTAVPNSFADILANNFLLGLSWESVNEFVGAIEAVTADEVQAAVTQYIEADQPAIVVVGDAEVLLPQLEELGEVVLVDAQGEPVE